MEDPRYRFPRLRAGLTGPYMEKTACKFVTSRTHRVTRRGIGSVIVLAIYSPVETALSSDQLELGGREGEEPKRRPEEKRLHHHQRECECDQGEKEFPSSRTSLPSDSFFGKERCHVPLIRKTMRDMKIDVK